MKSDDIKADAETFGDQAARSAADAAQTAKDKAAGARATAMDYADQASQTTQDLYGRAKERVRSAGAAMPDSASDAVAAGQRVMDRGTAQLSRHVAKQPLEALILAGAIGYLVGWATSRG